MIPVIDHLNEHLASAAVSQKYNHVIRAAILIGKRTLNQYYDRTDQSELYQIAIGMLYVLSIHASALIHLNQCYTPTTSCPISTMLVGLMIGLRLWKSLSEMSMTAPTAFELTLSSLLQGQKMKANLSTIYLTVYWHSVNLHPVPLPLTSSNAISPRGLKTWRMKTSSCGGISTNFVPDGLWLSNSSM